MPTRERKRRLKRKEKYHQGKILQKEMLKNKVSETEADKAAQNARDIVGVESKKIRPAELTGYHSIAKRQRCHEDGDVAPTCQRDNKTGPIPGDEEDPLPARGSPKGGPQLQEEEDKDVDTLCKQEENRLEMFNPIRGFQSTTSSKVSVIRQSCSTFNRQPPPIKAMKPGSALEKLTQHLLKKKLDEQLTRPKQEPDSGGEASKMADCSMSGDNRRSRRKGTPKHKCNLSSSGAGGDQT